MKAITILLLISIAGLLVTPSLIAQERLVLPAGGILSISSPEDSLAQRTLLRFDLPAKLANATIDYAILRFKAEPAPVGKSAARLSLVVHPVSSGWNNNTTWSEGWKRAGGDFRDRPSTWHAVAADAGNLVEALVTEIVQDWVDGKYENNGLLVLSTAEGSVSFELVDHERRETDRLAELIIWYTDKD
jgi:hypothetical protein